MVKRSTTPKSRYYTLRLVSRCFCFSDTKISQVSVATRLRCGGIFYYYLFIEKFNAKSVDEGILKIGQHQAKLEAKIAQHLISDTVH